MSKSQKKKSNDGKRIVFLLCSVVLFVVILISTVFNDWTQIMENRVNTKEYQTYYEQLQEEEASLNSEILSI